MAENVVNELIPTVAMRKGGQQYTRQDMTTAPGERPPSSISSQPIKWRPRARRKALMRPTNHDCRDVLIVKLFACQPLLAVLAGSPAHLWALRERHSC